VNKPKAVDFLHFLDRELSRRPFIAGDKFSIADITGFVAIQFMKPARIQMPDGLIHVGRWYESVSARASAGA